MESKAHHTLVKYIYRFVSSMNEIEKSLIESDIFEINGNVTRMNEGFVPDLYYNYNNYCIIGEAKTEGDLDREHSINQYKSYISHLEKKCSNGCKCLIVIAVPWSASITAYKIIKRIIGNKYGIRLVVINELGVYKEYEKNSIE